MKQPQESELLKAYLAFVAIEAVLAVLGYIFLPQGTNIAEAMNQTSGQKTISTLLSLYNFAVFIMSIVVWYQWRKEQWSWKIKLLPKLATLLPIVMVIAGVTISLKSMGTYLQLNPNIDPSVTPTPEQLQALVPQSALWLSYISFGINIALGIYAIVLLVSILQQPQSLHTKTSGPTTATEQKKE